MATQPAEGLTYADLRALPEDNLRREIIGGELIVTAAPGRRDQDAVLELAFWLVAHVKRHGGKVYVAPRDVYFTERDVVEPDVVYVAPASLDRDEEPFVRGPPDLVEVSSPSTRRLELFRKRDLFGRFGVPEYWCVDLDADRVEVYRLAGAGYGPPEIVERGGTLTSPSIPGFAIAVDDVLGLPPD